MQSIRTLVDVGNGQKGYETLIGRVHVTEPFTVRTSEQTACNYYEIEIGPGVYDVVDTGYWVMVRYEGTIVDEHFVNRLFGSSSLAEKKSIGGRSRRGASQLNDYIAAEKFATDPAWELAEDYRVEMTTWARADMAPRKRYKLVAPD